MIVAFEGLDGAGKNTQTRRLYERAGEAGLKVGLTGFPRYGENVFSQQIAAYLNGAFGPLDRVPPQLPALLYAGDRFASRESLEQLVAASDLVIIDRYVPSNLAYQAARFPEAERAQFIRWLIEIEHDIYQLPRPDVIIELQLESEFVQAQVLKKAPRDYTDKAADLHESNESFLAQCFESYHAVAELYPYGKWVRVPCTAGSETLRPREEIAAEIWAALQPFLAIKGSPAK